jgi:hypothetical protein
MRSTNLPSGRVGRPEKLSKKRSKLSSKKWPRIHDRALPDAAYAGPARMCRMRCELQPRAGKASPAKEIILVGPLPPCCGPPRKAEFEHYQRNRGRHDRFRPLSVGPLRAIIRSGRRSTRRAWPLGSSRRQCYLKLDKSLRVGIYQERAICRGATGGFDGCRIRPPGSSSTLASR